MYGLFHYQVEIDKKATKEWYAAAAEWNCSCESCRNFVSLARKRKFPEPVLKILDDLEIPPEKATYVCELYPDEAGVCYQFSYRIAGYIASGEEHSLVKTDWGGVCCCHEPYPFGAPGFPEPHFDLEFNIMLPFLEVNR